ncbi:MAG: hypothetical protein J6Y98_06885 [Bacteroidales bacterium]|nr:hypothetical protein [Prevotella sp.]MBP5327615.1 hypothetical protein [Bacteroidales bacterium]MCR5193618.1 hypothetical protein [Bacteroidales bacterium]
METNISKVSLLWVIIMVGFAMHMLTDMLPAFWGANIAMPDATGEAPSGMMMFMIGMAFFVPMCGLLCMNYRKCKAMRVVNFVLATVMMLFNLFHATELLTEFNPVQLLIHPVMAAIGIFLFIYSLRLMKQKE